MHLEPNDISDLCEGEEKKSSVHLMISSNRDEIELFSSMNVPYRLSEISPMYMTMS